MQSLPKPQFASWLLEQVNSGQYKGLYFVDHNRFRVPWKHNSKKDCNDDDSKIFKAWAKVSGKIRKFPNDKARWKLNFRCALNGRFTMVEDNSKTADPHKIYEVNNTGYNNEQMMTQDSQEDSSMSPELFNSPTEVFPLGNQFNLLNHFKDMDLGSKPGEDQNLIEDYTQLNPSVPVAYPAVAEHHLQHLDPAPGIGFVNQPSIYDLEITIHYRNREMLKRTLTSSLVQLHYMYPDVQRPEFNTVQLCFPTPDGLPDQKQVELTNTLLGSIQRGVLLEVRETGIWALRKDLCRVFSSTGVPGVAHQEPTKLPQNTPVELLNFQNYVKELRAFKENGGRSPQYTINMCFGEKLSAEKPLEKKLIVVKVVPLICKHFHEMALMEGASSLHSSNISLQISHDSLFDLISSAFSLPSAE